MRENLEYMISAINAATISAVAHRSNGLIDNNYDRAQEIEFHLRSVCERINRDEGEIVAWTKFVPVYEITFFSMRDSSFGNTLIHNRSKIYLGEVPLIRFDNDGIEKPTTIFRYKGKLI